MTDPLPPAEHAADELAPAQATAALTTALQTIGRRRRPRVQSEDVVTEAVSIVDVAIRRHRGRRALVVTYTQNGQRGAMAFRVHEAWLRVLRGRITEALGK
jgi:hypothetical protein